MNKDILIYDTTLRDGSQTDGVSFSVNDKIRITEKLDELGVHYIEGGWPGSNPKDREYYRHFNGKKLKKAVITAFSMTRRAHTTCAKDGNIQELLRSGARTMTIVGKSWDLHVRDILKVSLDENLKMIADTVAYFKKRGLEVIYDAEHFFDGYKRNPDYAAQTVRAAAGAGADWVVPCDTNGGALPGEIGKIIRDVRGLISAPLGIHCHDDLDMGVANSLAAVEAGCAQVQGTFNGLGERCGNANLTTIISVLHTKYGIKTIPARNIKKLMETSYYIAELSNVPVATSAAFIGHRAFTHKGGMHIDAVIKNPVAYEHVDPCVVGNHRRFVASELAGKMPLVQKALQMNVSLDKKSPQAAALMKDLQDKEFAGYQFEAADASFELFVKRHLAKYKPFFKLEGFRTHSEKRNDGQTFAEASIRIEVDGQSRFSAAEGDGPVDALDKALRGALAPSYPALEHMRLTDYKVRVLNSKEGAAAKVRVLIESQDDKDSWTTMGVHENIIEASWEALTDSIEYKLLKDQN
jgi:2-isopropylmalate synthase